ncbi:MAG: ANTAR domain-containing protein [Clostridia bacterium]|nr:ANTAR domain-containing protein [Clostridia bacterium]
MKPLVLDLLSDRLTLAVSAAEARRLMLDQQYDIVIINAPLTDESGTRFAVDCSAGKPVACLLMAPANVYEALDHSLSSRGIFVLQKPTSTIVLSQGLRWLLSAREALRGMEAKAMSVEEKMEQIRLVNRAKWALIEHLQMSEPEAHRYIEKQAMDHSVSRKKIAEDILKIYEN